ncbi:ribokinase [Terrilactibacillus sp. S3-3]|nr:ribokinase [Terrilactibacillus sp. S3-3]
MASARLQASVNLVGCVGGDLFGQQLLEQLKAEHVNVTHVKALPEERTGAAMIVLSDGDNRIIVVQGANDKLTESDIDEAEAVIAESDVVLMQLEVPMGVVIHAAEVAKIHGVKVVLDPAPMLPLPDKLLRMVDYITPNEVEYGSLKEEERRHLQEKLIITLGERGCAIFQDGIRKIIPGEKVEAVDTTGAGDAFCGALSVQLAKGERLEDACRFANRIGALAATKRGAQG